MNIKKMIMRGGISALAGRIFTILIHIANTVLLARILSPDEMAGFFLIMSILGFLTLVAPAGTTISIVRFVAQSLNSEDNGWARSAILRTLYICFCGSLMIAIIYVLGLGNFLAKYVFHSYVIASVTIIVSLIIILITIKNAVAEILRGFHFIFLSIFFSGILSGIFTAFCYGFIFVFYKESNLKIILSIQSVSAFISLCISIIFLHKKMAPLKTEIELPFNAIFKISIPMMLTSLMTFVLTWADLWIVGSILPIEDVAIYGAARRIVIMVIIPFGIIQAFIPPIIAELYANSDLKNLERALRITATVAFLPVFFVFLIICLWGETILSLLYGEFYKKGVSVLLILCLGQIVNTWTGSCGIALNMSGFESIRFYYTGITGVLTFIFAYLSAFKFGINGVALVYAGGMICQNIAILFVTRSKCGVWTCANLNPLDIYRTSKKHWDQVILSKQQG